MNLGLYVKKAFDCGITHVRGILLRTACDKIRFRHFPEEEWELQKNVCYCKWGALTGYIEYFDEGF